MSTPIPADVVMAVARRLAWQRAGQLGTSGHATLAEPVIEDLHLAAELLEIAAESLEASLAVSPEISREQYEKALEKQMGAARDQLILSARRTMRREIIAAADRWNAHVHLHGAADDAGTGLSLPFSRLLEHMPEPGAPAAPVPDEHDLMWEGAGRAAGDEHEGIIPDEERRALNDPDVLRAAGEARGSRDSLRFRYPEGRHRMFQGTADVSCRAMEKQAGATRDEDEERRFRDQLVAGAGSDVPLVDDWS